jgi:hypothetical protein
VGLLAESFRGSPHKYRNFLLDNGLWNVIKKFSEPTQELNAAAPVKKDQFSDF